MQKEFDQYYFKQSIKKNQFISFGIRDKNGTMYKEDGTFIANIKEFSERMKLLSQGSTIIIDDKYLIANEYQQISEHNTIVICDNVTKTKMEAPFKHRRKMEFVNKRDFHNILYNHELTKKSPLFICVDSSIMETISMCFDSMELIELDRVCENGSDDKLYISNLLKRRTKLNTEESTKNNKLQDSLDNFCTREEEIVSGSMKIITKIDKKSLIGYKYNLVRLTK